MGWGQSYWDWESLRNTGYRSSSAAHQGAERNQTQWECLIIKTSPCLCGPVFQHIILIKWTAGRENGFLVVYEAKNLLNILYKVVEKMSKPSKF